MINEVAPPGWGHTKAEKEKTKPNKPKSKIGGSAAAFKRALDVVGLKDFLVIRPRRKRLLVCLS